MPRKDIDDSREKGSTKKRKQPGRENVESTSDGHEKGKLRIESSESQSFIKTIPPHFTSSLTIPMSVTKKNWGVSTNEKYPMTMNCMKIDIE